MLLKSVSPFVAIDEIITIDSKQYIHFITHLDQSFVILDGWQSVIYTSKHIANVLAIKKIPIPSKYFKILNENQLYHTTTSDGTLLRFRMFEEGSLRRNVLFHFETASSKVIYTGPYRLSQAIYLNDIFRDCMQSKVDELYVDNTRVRSSDIETVETTADAIYNISVDYPDYLLFLNFPVFGYEDLIHTLVNKYELKVFAGSFINEVFKRQKMDSIFTRFLTDARIVIGEGCITVDILKRRYAHKRLTIHLVESDFQVKNVHKKYGLVLLEYTPHPSLFELHALINFVRPYSVHGIYEDMPTLPRCLTCLCTKKASVECPTQQHEPTCPEQMEAISSGCTSVEDKPIVSRKSNKLINLPRKVTGSQYKRMNASERFISRIAIIKPTPIRIEEIADESQDQETTEYEKADREGHQESAESEIDFNEPLSNLSLSDFSLGSSPSDSSLDDAEACGKDDHYAYLVHAQRQDNTRRMQPQEQSRREQPILGKSKRKHLSSNAASIKVKNSGKFVERRCKSKTFSKQPLAIRYSSDVSSD